MLIIINLIANFKKIYNAKTTAACHLNNDETTLTHKTVLFHNDVSPIIRSLAAKAVDKRIQEDLGTSCSFCRYQGTDQR